MTRLVYLATPYSKHPAGLECAHKQACKAVAALLRRKVAAYSPIAHGHPVALHGGLDPLDHAIWLPFDQHMMDVCGELWIVQMPGWDDSYGIEQERKYFAGQGKPIRWLTWPELEDVDMRRAA